MAMTMLAGIALAEENEMPMPEEAGVYSGTWMCDRAVITMDWEEEGFRVLIRWGSSAWEQTEWEYSCYYHEDVGTLVSMPFGIRTDYRYNEAGEVVSAEEIYNDGEAVFSLDEEGYLLWMDARENAGEGLKFVRVEITQDDPDADG